MMVEPASNAAIVDRLTRLEERVAANTSSVDKYIALTTTDNTDLEKRVRVTESIVSGINVQLKVIGAIGITSLAGVLGLLIRLFETSVK